MFNKTYYKGKHSPIIDEELFNAANSKAWLSVFLTNFNANKIQLHIQEYY
jgi:hypothetical protein